VVLSSRDVEKYIGSLNVINIWQELFTYDELTINMRQKNDQEFLDTVNRIRIGMVTDSDMKMLESRKISLQTDTVEGTLREIVRVLRSLPRDTVCLVPTKHTCKILNTAMLNEICCDEVRLIAEDSVDCCRQMKGKVQQWLTNSEDDASTTAGMEHTIVVKPGAKVMLRRNIDVTIGLVNGSIGTIKSIQRSTENLKQIKSVTIQFSHV
jgi:hypothetical protein